jgi:glycosyltransferase involved in cell wall biosynthesis
VISLVVPFRDELDNIESLVEAVHQALDADTFETTCVNDGSRDGSGAS